VIGSGKPEKSGGIPETSEADGIADSAEVFGGGEDSIGSDEPADLEEQRVEGGEIDEAESAEKEPARNEAIAVAVRGVEEPTENGGEAGVHGQRACAISNIQASNRKWRSKSSAESRVRRREERRGVSFAAFGESTLGRGSAPNSNARRR
jgi:hypothetical protein